MIAVPTCSGDFRTDSIDWAQQRNGTFADDTHYFSTFGMTYKLTTMHSSSPMLAVERAHVFG
jgi:hypothetical protein